MDKTTFIKGKVSGREIIFAKCMGKKRRVYGFMVSTIESYKVKVGSVDTHIIMVIATTTKSLTDIMWGSKAYGFWCSCASGLPRSY